MQFIRINEEITSNNNSLFRWKLNDLCTQKLILQILCAIAILASAIVLITMIIIQTPVIYTDNYAVVIDAGSTGSRAYLYKWKDSADRDNDVVTELMNCKSGKLQTIDWVSPDNLLIGCIVDLIGDIPSGLFIRPYIYLAATAGMRLYQKEKPKETDEMFKNIEKMFYSKGWRSQYIGIISGEVEGISAWITANVLKNKIGKGIKRQETVGAIDLGGSSTQISYESPTSSNKITLYNQEYSVYGTSYLCYGTNMFDVKYMTYVASTSKETSFNCLLKNTPIVLRNDVKVCRYLGSENLNFTTVSKKIDSDPAKCLQQISAIVDSELKLSKAPANARFVAISAFNYVFQFLDKYFGKVTTMKQFESGVAEFCKQDFNDIPKKYAKERKYAGRYCLLGTYITKLFSSYGITDLSNLEFTEKIHGQNVGWNLGYMIENTRSIPNAYIRKLSPSLFVPIVVIASVVLVASVASVGYFVAKRRHKLGSLEV